MKKLIFIAVLAIGLLSCEKKYTENSNDLSTPVIVADMGNTKVYKITRGLTVIYITVSINGEHSSIVRL